MKTRFFRNLTLFLLMISMAFLGFAKGSKDAGQTPETLPDWSEDRPIPDFGFSDGEMPPEPPEGFDPSQFGENPPTPPEGFPEDFDPTKMGQMGGMMGGNPPENTAKTNQSSRNILTNEDDQIENINFASSVEINLSKGNIKYFGNANENNVDIQLNDSGYQLSSSLAEPLNIKLSGKMSGTFTVESSEDILALTLDGVEITATDGPAINLLTKKKTFVNPTKNSKNVLTDSVERNENTKKGALYAKAALVFDSMDEKSGAITVNAGYKHGIYSDDYIKINDGNVNVNITARDAVRSINGFIMNDGNLTIRGTGTEIDDESKGIKVDGEESSKYAGEGFIVINGGNIDITTVGKGITASFEVEEDAETETTSDDPNPYLTINGGTIKVTTTATPYEKTLEDGTEVSCSPEGLESKSDLTINGGKITLRTPDDAINAAISITINGGEIDIVSTQNDAIDSNGTLTINGGTVYATGGSGAETAFDSDMYPFVVNGGTIFGVGGANLTTPNASSKANVVVWYGNFTKDKTITVKDSEGKKILSYKPAGNGQGVVFSSEQLVKGKTYTVTDGTSEETFTIEDNVTTIGNARGFGGPGGFDGGRNMNDRMNFKGNNQNRNQKNFDKRDFNKETQNNSTENGSSKTI